MWVGINRLQHVFLKIGKGIRSLFLLPQKNFGLGPDVFLWIEVWRISWPSRKDGDLLLLESSEESNAETKCKSSIVLSRSELWVCLVLVCCLVLGNMFLVSSLCSCPMEKLLAIEHNLEAPAIRKTFPEKRTQLFLYFDSPFLSAPLFWNTESK